jgi:hypothetical protein
MYPSFETFSVDVAAGKPLAPLISRLTDTGIATFALSRVNADSLIELAESLGTVMPHRDADEYGVTRIVSGSRATGPGYAGFSTNALPLHTDRAGTPAPPTLLVMLCSVPADSGGESIFVDGEELFSVLAHERPDILAAAQRPGCVFFGGDGDALRTSIFSKIDERRVAVRFRSDELATIMRPLRDHLPALLAIMERLSIRIPLRCGQGYVVQNGRWLHGRTAFTGQREAYRVLVEPPRYSPIRRGFPVAHAPAVSPRTLRTGRGAQAA